MKSIPVSEPLLDGNEKKYILECIDGGWISSEGEFVQRFEEQFARYVGRKYGIALCNGTVGLELAMQLIDLEKGSEVIMPAFTIISCAQAVIRAGLVPVLVDSDISTWNMDVAQIASKITNKTKAIMVVHIYGLPVNMAPVMELAKKHDLRIIEDAAEMHGQTYNESQCGSFGDISVFSFYSNKHITTGEGGMILTDDEKIAERCRSMRNLCHSKEKRFVHYELGYNYRMTNLQAAIGLAQLEGLERHLHLKRQIGLLYTEMLKDCTAIQLPLTKTSYASNVYWVFGILLLGHKKAEAVMECLQKKGIGTRPFFCPMHKQPVFQKMGLFVNERYPNAELLYENGFYIPSAISLVDEDIAYIAETLLSVV